MLTAFLWLLYASLLVVFIVGALVAAWAVTDTIRSRRSSWRHWDREMREFNRARRVTSQEVK